MNRRPVLELDDPLAPRRPAVASEAPTADTTDRSHEQPAESTKTPTTRRPGRRRGQNPVASVADPPDAVISRELSVVGESSSPASNDGAWRSWAGGTRVASYRLPDELLEELDERARRLGVPIGMTVAAGLLQLFDQDDESIVRLVERAEDARVLARRAARRRS
jgi:hypothetical protein